MNINNKCIFNNISNLLLLQSLVILVSAFYLELAQAEEYKCKDENGNVTYSDERCLNQTRQKLDIIVAPVDKSSAERLKYYKDYDSSGSGIKNNITIIEAQQPSNRCNAYSDKIKQLKNQLRAGYTPELGESIRESIKQASKSYSDCMDE